MQSMHWLICRTRSKGEKMRTVIIILATFIALLMSTFIAEAIDVPRYEIILGMLVYWQISAEWDRIVKDKGE